MFRWSLFCVLALSTFLISPSHAGTIALVPNGGVRATDTGSYTFGWTFSTQSSINVTALGFIDLEEPGLLESHDIGIFDLNSGTLLVSANLGSGTTGYLQDGHRFVDIAAFTLAAGDYFIGATIGANSEPWLHNADEPSVAPGITYGTSGFRLDAGLGMATSFGSAPEGYFGPNFLFEPSSEVPEPGTLTLIGGSALFGLLLGQCRQYRQLSSPLAGCRKGPKSDLSQSTRY